ncbi:MAG: hypothetical protein QM652_00215 [Legionella sp.]|uniref:hypothetical protein n=1 Tax=Legionella sp. TaxID=459 RepID=UPI0039E35F32
MNTRFIWRENISYWFVINDNKIKEGLKARAAKGIKLGKPKGVIQTSMYDKNKEKTLHLYQLSVPLQKIIETHLGYGKYLSLKAFIKKLKK